MTRAQTPAEIPSPAGVPPPAEVPAERPAEAPAEASGSAPAEVPADQEGLTADIERSRAELGEAVAELKARTDVKARARDARAELRHRAADATARLRQSATGPSHERPLFAAAAALAAIGLATLWRGVGHRPR